MRWQDKEEDRQAEEAKGAVEFYHGPGSSAMNAHHGECKHGRTMFTCGECREERVKEGLRLERKAREMRGEKLTYEELVEISERLACQLALMVDQNKKLRGEVAMRRAIDKVGR
jgi:hypothetical protein